MMQSVHRVRGENASPTDGVVKLDWPKVCWNMGFIVISILLAPFTYSHEAFLFFVGTTYVSLLVGHSVGMHRMMIHKTFDCPPVIEKILIYIGVLVGMSGPYGILRIHDIRDWAQRQNSCHAFFAHTQNYYKDLWWQLTSKFVFERPPVFTIENKLSENRFYQWLDKTWRWHQLGLGMLLYGMGGWDFVVWGVFVRVSVGIVGHWTITYFCHRPGIGKWRVKNANVQGANIPGLGILTYGECWHNNHHAFPESACIGLESEQSDPAYRFIQLLGLLGFATNIGLPRPLSQQDDLLINGEDYVINR